MFAPPLFPVTLDVLPGHVEHVGFKAGETLTFEDGTEIATCPLRHPGGATGYRMDYAGRRVCYVSDMEHSDAGPDADVVAFCRGADLVVYDAMFTEAELPRCRGWGHSTWNAGVALCRAAGARSLVAFHHHQGHDDQVLAGDRGRARQGASRVVRGARRADRGVEGARAPAVLIGEANDRRPQPRHRRGRVDPIESDLPSGLRCEHLGSRLRLSRLHDVL